jgi:hypothetical protein
MSRWSPKQWTRPRSRAWRDARSPHVDLYEMIREMWPAGGGALERPAWAKLARKHGWMTRGDYYALPEDEWVPSTEPGIYEQLYRPSPFFQMLRKSANFNPTEAA